MKTEPNEAPHGSKTTEDVPPSLTQEAVGSATVLAVAYSSDSSVVGREVPLGEGLLAVGRDVEGAGLHVQDNRLSRLHFRIALDRRSGGHRIGDAGSRNGMFVNGKLTQSAVLQAGDVVRAGDTVFVYEQANPIRSVTEYVCRIASSPLRILLLGETGTGKERLARLVHEQSGRAGSFVPLNCAALPRDLLSAELFGHTRGAFSGAAHARRGLFQAADRGTLFLDEIGEFPLELQAVLLRALQEGTIRPLGSDNEIKVDVRVVSATHTDLAEAVRQHRFREDLFARLATTVVHVPTLRDRRAEVISLVNELAELPEGESFALTADAAELLVRWRWPLNIRELEAVVQSFCLGAGEPPLDMAYLRAHHPQIAADFRLSETQAPATSAKHDDSAGTRPDRTALERLLHKHRGNVSAMSAELEKPRALVYRWLRRAGLSPDRFR